MLATYAVSPRTASTPACRVNGARQEVNAAIAEWNRYRRGDEEICQRPINRKARVRIDEFIALFHQGHEGEKDRRFAARHDDNVLRGALISPRAAHVFGNGFAQFH